jgi:hypothetical protein
MLSEIVMTRSVMMDRHAGHRERVDAAVARLRDRFDGHVALARLARFTAIPVGTLRRILSGSQPLTLVQFLELASAAERPEWELLGPFRSAVQGGRVDPASDGAKWNHVDGAALAPPPAVQELTVPERLARRHDGVEWLYVAAGAIRLAAGTPAQAISLEAGEAVTIDASSLHRIIEVVQAPATVVRWMSASGLRAHVGGLNGPAVLGS